MKNRQNDPARKALGWGMSVQSFVSDGERLDKHMGLGHRTENASLHLNHFECGQMIAVIRRPGAVGKQEALVPAVVGLTHRGMDADIRGNAGQDNVLDAFLPQKHVEVRAIEGAFAWLIDDRFSGQWGQFGNDLPSRFSPRQNTPARSRIAYARADAAAAPAF